MSKKKIWLLCGLMTTVVAGGILFVKQSKENTASPQKLTVRLGWVHQTQFAGFYVAKEKGFYKKAGLDVTLLPLDLAKSQTEELGAGAVEASVVEAHQMLGGIDKGANIEAVVAIYQINPHILAARADSGIKGPDDFTSETVFGIAGGEGEGDAIFKVFIEKFAGIKGPKYVSLGFDTVNDFINKRVDVINTYQIDQPYLAKKKGVPLNIISLSAYGLTTYGDVLAMNKDFVVAHPDTVKKFVKATLKGWEYTLANTEEAIAITLPYTSGDYNDEEYLRHILTESVPLIQGPNGTTLGRMELAQWSTLYESMKSKNALTKSFDIKSVFTNEFIQ